MEAGVLPGGAVATVGPNLLTWAQAVPLTGLQDWYPSFDIYVLGVSMVTTIYTDGGGEQHGAHFGIFSNPLTQQINANPNIILSCCLFNYAKTLWGIDEGGICRSVGAIFDDNTKLFVPAGTKMGIGFTYGDAIGANERVDCLVNMFYQAAKA